VIEKLNTRSCDSSRLVDLRGDVLFAWEKKRD